MGKIKAVLFNGPPRSGKDTAAEWLTECLSHRISTRYYMPYNCKMAESLKLAAHALFGEETLHANAFEDCKDEPHPIFLDRTPRQVYIALSEQFAKPHYGNDFFGRIFANRVIGPENILIVHLHRRGCDFTNDSRSYIKIDGAEICHLTNDNITAFRMEVYSRVGCWLDGIKSPVNIHA